MERMKAIKQNRKLHKKFCRAMGCFLITLVLLCAAGGNLFAKYYAGQKNKGVGVASSLYFSSNVLKDVDDSDATTYPLIFNKESWDGTGSCSIEVDIRNFENQLLYNDRNLDITYNISFSLVSDTDGGSYSVTYMDASDQQEIKDITKSSADATFSDYTLSGGSLERHVFKVNVTRPDSEKSNTKYRSVGIKVVAKPVAPSFVSNSITLGGIVYATMMSATYSMDCTLNLDSGTAPSDYVGFPYVISYTPGADQSAHEVKISWTKEILEMNYFEPYYQKLKEDSTKYGTETIDSIIWQYMIITIQPYSNIQITFYRASSELDYSNVVLSDRVKVEDLTQHAGGSGN